MPRSIFSSELEVGTGIPTQYWAAVAARDILEEGGEPVPETPTTWRQEQRAYLVWHSSNNNYYYRHPDGDRFAQVTGVWCDEFVRPIYDRHRGVGGWDRAFFEGIANHPDGDTWYQSLDILAHELLYEPDAHDGIIWEGWVQEIERRNRASLTLRTRRPRTYNRGLCIIRQQRARCDNPSCPCYGERQRVRRRTRPIENTRSAFTEITYDAMLDAYAYMTSSLTGGDTAA